MSSAQVGTPWPFPHPVGLSSWCGELPAVPTRGRTRGIPGGAPGVYRGMHQGEVGAKH